MVFSDVYYILHSPLDFRQNENERDVWRVAKHPLEQVIVQLTFGLFALPAQPFFHLYVYVVLSNFKEGIRLGTYEYIQWIDSLSHFAR